jgi:Putative MetA-pathway of phenol degradation
MKICLSIFLFLFYSYCYAQDTTHINTDRPDQSDGAYIVHPNIFQFETGAYLNTLDEYNQALVQSSMLRYGLIKRVELRLLFEVASLNNQYYHSVESGLLPLALCSKIALVKHKARSDGSVGRGIIPDITLSGYLRLPFTASKNFKPAYYSSTGLLVFQHYLSDDLTLAYNAGLSRSGDDKTISYPVTAVLIYAPEEHFSFFAEYYAFYQPEHIPSNNIDIGFLYCIKHHMQFDIALGTLLLPKAKNNFVTLGFSYRFD